MSSVISIGALRYDILMDNVSFAKGMQQNRRELKQAEKAFRDSLTPVDRYSHAKMRLDSLQKKGLVTQRAYQVQLEQLRRQYSIDTAAVMANTNSHMARVIVRQRELGLIPPELAGLAADTTALNTNTAAVLANNAARHQMTYKDLSNLGGASMSAVGLGGVGGAFGRLGGLATMGPAAAAVGGIAAGAAVLAKATKEFVRFNEQQVVFESMVGKELGSRLVEEFKELARVTALSTEGIMANAKMWVSYGLTTENLTYRMELLGRVAGGNAQRMQDLTRAFAQVNVTGRLMGQEVLQLSNAGFDLSAIAKAAGVSMTSFKQAVEDGKISAANLNQALIDIATGEGKFANTMNDRAKTLAGQWDTTTEQIQEELRVLGESFSNLALIPALEKFQDILFVMKEIRGLGEDLGKWLGSPGENGGPSLAERWGITPEIAEQAGEYAKWLQRAISPANMLFGVTHDMRVESEKAAEAAAKEKEELEKQALIRQNMRDQQLRNAQQFEFGSEAEGLAEELEKARYLAEAEAAGNMSSNYAEVEFWYKKQLERINEMRKANQLSAQDYRRIRTELEDAYELKKQMAELDDEAERKKELEQWKDKAERDAEREAEKAKREVDKKERESIAALDKATKPAPGFSAGSMGEYKFLSEMAIQNRKNDMTLEIMKRAEADRKQIATNTQTMIDEIRKANEIPADADIQGVSDL